MRGDIYVHICAYPCMGAYGEVTIQFVVGLCTPCHLLVQHFETLRPFPNWIIADPTTCG